MDMKAVGANLKSLRIKHNLTQEQLAEKFNISSRSVSRWETGTNFPDISILIELAEFYQVDIMEILKVDERKSENMDIKEKDTIQAISDYKDEEQRVLKKRVSILLTVSLALIILVSVFRVLTPYMLAPGYWLLGGIIGLIISSIVMALLFINGKLHINLSKRAKAVRIAVIVTGIIAFIAGFYFTSVLYQRSQNVISDYSFTRGLLFDEEVTDYEIDEYLCFTSEDGNYSISFKPSCIISDLLFGIRVTDEYGNTVCTHIVRNGEKAVFTEALKKHMHCRIKIQAFSGETDYSAFIEKYGINRVSEEAYSPIIEYQTYDCYFEILVEKE